MKKTSAINASIATLLLLAVFSGGVQAFTPDPGTCEQDCSEIGPWWWTISGHDICGHDPCSWPDDVMIYDYHWSDCLSSFGADIMNDCRDRSVTIEGLYGGAECDHYTVSGWQGRIHFGAESNLLEVPCDEVIIYQIVPPFIPPTTCIEDGFVSGTKYPLYNPLTITGSGYYLDECND